MLRQETCSICRNPAARRNLPDVSVEREILDIGGREVAISNPRKVLFPQAGYTKLDLARYYLAVADGRAAGRRRTAQRARALSRTASAASSSFRSARRSRGRRGSRWSRCGFPSGRSAEEVVPRDAGRARRGWPTSPASSCIPHPVRADDLDHPDELRVDLDPVPGVELGADPRGRARRARHARRLRARRLAEDLGLARHARLRAHRAALDVRRGAPRRAGAGARGRAARAEPGDEQVVEGGAPRRVPRLQPERQGSHHRERRIRCGRRPMRACRRRSPGTRSTRASLATSRWRRCRRASPRSATGTRPWIEHPGSLEACSSCRRATSARGWATRRGRRTTRSRRASRRACSRRAAATPTHPLIEIGRAQRQSGRARRPRALEGAPPRRRRAPRARRRARRRDARAVSDLDAHPREPAARAGRAAPAAGGARSRRSSRRLERRQRSRVAAPKTFTIS